MHAKASIAALAVVSLLGLMGHNGGCHPDDGQPLGTPVSAVGMVLEDDGALSAQLVVVSTATDPQTRVDTDAAALVGPDEQARALTRVERGVYALDGEGLDYRAGESYAFELTVGAEAAEAARVFAGSFRLAMHGLIDVPDVDVAESVTEGEPLTVGWTPAMGAVVELRGSDGAVVYTSFDVHAPLSYDTWKALDDSTIASGGELTIAADALPAVGSYELRVCTVDVGRRDDAPSQAPQHLTADDGASRGLGSLSGMVVGRCRRTPLEVVGR